MTHVPPNQRAHINATRMAARDRDPCSGELRGCGRRVRRPYDAKDDENCWLATNTKLSRLIDHFVDRAEFNAGATQEQVKQAGGDETATRQGEPQHSQLPRQLASSRLKAHRGEDIDSGD